MNKILLNILKIHSQNVWIIQFLQIIHSYSSSIKTAIYPNFDFVFFLWIFGKKSVSRQATDKIGEQIRELFNIDINPNGPAVKANNYVSTYMKRLYKQLENYEHGFGGFLF